MTLLSCRNYAIVAYENIDVVTTSNSFSKSDSIISLYKAVIDSEMNELIGYSVMSMNTGFPEGLLGNFVADLMLESVKTIYPLNNVFSLTNNGGLRTAMPSGPVYRKDIFEIMPFDNQVVVLKLDSNLMKDLFNYIISGDEMAVGGCHLIYKDKKLLKAVIDSADWNKSETYYLVTLDYLANGGSGMFFLKKAEIYKKTNVLLRDMIIAYIKDKNIKGELISSETDGRIIILNNE